MESISMSQQTTMYQFRIDAQEKQEVFQIFNELGVKPSQAIKMFFRQVKETRSIPFDVKLPNKETIETMEKVKQGQELNICKNSDDLFDKLGI